MSDNVIRGLVNPQPILQQDKSSIVTTNPFIPNEQKTRELTELQNQANTIIEDAYKENKTSTIAYMSITDISKNLSTSVSGLFDDLFTKPNDIPWNVYIPMILQKEQRYAYLGILLILISLYIIITRH